MERMWLLLLAAALVHAQLTQLSSDQTVIIKSVFSGSFLSTSNQLVKAVATSSTATLYRITAVSGGYTIRDTTTGLYASADNAGTSPVIANRYTAQGWETFGFTYLGSYNWGIIATANNQYLTASTGGQLIANNATATKFAYFSIQTATPATTATTAPAPTSTSNNKTGICGIQWGTFQAPPWGNQLGLTVSYDKTIQRNSDIIHFYSNWDDGTGDFTNPGTLQSWVPPAVTLQDYKPGTHIPLITWQAWKQPYGTSNNYYSYTAIAGGQFDAYIKTAATQIKAWGFLVYLRPFHEFDGDWYPWGNVNGNTGPQFISAWQRIVQIFRTLGVTNVRFVWCPNNSNGKGVYFENYFPGDQYVDFIGMDGYAGNTDGPWAGMWNANSSPSNPYSRMTKISTKPVIICEFGVGGVGPGGKTIGQWHIDMANSLSSMPRIQGIVAFNTGNFAINLQDSAVVASMKSIFANC